MFLASNDYNPTNLIVLSQNTAKKLISCEFLFKYCFFIQDFLIMVPTRLVGWTPEIFAGISKGRHIKKSFFFVVGPLRFYPQYINGLVVHAPFFFTLILALYGFRQFISIFPNFWLNFLHFSKKKCFLAHWSGGFTLPSLLVVRSLKKTFFLCVSLLYIQKKDIQLRACLRVCPFRPSPFKKRPKDWKGQLGKQKEVVERGRDRGNSRSCTSFLIAMFRYGRACSGLQFQYTQHT